MAKSKRISIDRGATLYKQGRCWYLDFCENGLRSRKSLHTAQRDQAIAIARNLIAQKTERSWDVPIPREVGYTDFIEEYKAYSKRYHAESTQKLNWPILERFKKFVVERRRLNRALRLSDVKREDVEAFQAGEASRNLRNDRKENRSVENKTINVYVEIVSVFFNLAKERGFVRANPAERVRPLPVVKNRIPKTLSPEEIQALLDESVKSIPNLGPGRKGNGTTRERRIPLHDMIRFALNTGPRLGEMLYLEWDDVDFRSCSVAFRDKPEHHLKDREERLVKTNDAVLDMLRCRKVAAGSCRWVFPSAVGGVLHRRNALRELKVIAEHVGIPWANWQVFRRTFTTTCARSGMPSFVLKEMLGHSSVRTTERYYVGVAGGSAWIPPITGA